jgi:hypothetical protein
MTSEAEPPSREPSESSEPSHATPEARGNAPVVPGTEAAASGGPPQEGALWQPTGGPPSRRRRIAVALIAVVGVIVIAAWIGNLVNRAAASYASEVYGGPFQKLSSADRDALEARFERILGHTLDGMSEDQIKARVEQLVLSGLPRLDDSHLVQRLRLETTAIDRALEADCAAFARASLGGRGVSPEIGTTLISKLEPPDLATWFGLQADAMEAELAASAAQQRVTDSDLQATYQAIFAAMDQASVDRIAAVNGDPAGATDAAACAAVRSIYDTSVKLGSPDIELMARLDIS